MMKLKQLLSTESKYMLREPQELVSSIDTERKILNEIANDSNKYFIVALSDDDTEICGYCLIEKSPFLRSNHVGTLILGVQQAHWRKGIGRNLLQQAVA